MSDQLRAALRALDADIAAAETRLAQLRACRTAIADVVGEAPAPAADVLERPAPPSAPRSSGGLGTQAADRIVAALRSASGRPLRYPDLAKAGGAGYNTTKAVLRQLLASGRIRKTGKTSQTRYFLGSAGAPPAEPEGDRGARRARGR